MADRWDVRLSPAGSQGETLKMNLPVALGRALIAAGFNRAILTVTDDGILMAPFRGDPTDKRSTKLIDLPPGWGA